MKEQLISIGAHNGIFKSPTRRVVITRHPAKPAPVTRELFESAYRAVRENGGSFYFALTLAGKRRNHDAWLASKYFPRHVGRQTKVDAIAAALKVYHAERDPLAHKQARGVGVDPALLEQI